MSEGTNGNHDSKRSWPTDLQQSTFQWLPERRADSPSYPCSFCSCSILSLVFLLLFLCLCASLSLSLNLYIYIYLYLSLNLFVSLSLSISLSLCLSLFLSISLSLSLSLAISLSLSLYFYMSVVVSRCLIVSDCLSLFLAARAVSHTLPLFHAVLPSLIGLAASNCLSIHMSLSHLLCLCSGNYRYRIEQPEELIAITETDLCEFQQKISHYRYRFSLEFQWLQIQMSGSKRINSVIISATTVSRQIYPFLTLVILARVQQRKNRSHQEEQWRSWGSLTPFLYSSTTPHQNQRDCPANIVLERIGAAIPCVQTSWTAQELTVKSYSAMYFVLQSLLGQMFLNLIQIWNYTYSERDCQVSNGIL